MPKSNLVLMPGMTFERSTQIALEDSTTIVLIAKENENHIEVKIVDTISCNQEDNMDFGISKEELLFLGHQFLRFYDKLIAEEERECRI